MTHPDSNNKINQRKRENPLRDNSPDNILTEDKPNIIEE